MKNQESQSYGLLDRVTATVTKKGKTDNLYGYSAIWHWKCYRRGLLMWEERYENLVVDEGLVYSLGTAFKNAEKKTAWYIALFEDNHTPIATDKFSAPGFTECVAYDETTRPLWNSGDIVANAVSNLLNLASFTMSATKMIYGGALVSDNRKGIPSAAATWAPSHAYALGQVVTPTTPNDHYYQCTTAGTSGSAEPTWPTNGSTVNDGTVVWTDRGTITNEIMFSSGVFDVPKPVDDDDIVKVSVEITAKTISV